MWNLLKRLFVGAQGVVAIADSLDELGDVGKEYRDVGQMLVELTRSAVTKGGITEAQRRKAHSENGESTHAVGAYIDSLPRR